MTTDKPLTATLSERLPDLTVQEVPLHPKPLRGRRQVVDLKPVQEQEVRESGDKKIEGEHHPKHKETIIMSNTQSQQFTPPAGHVPSSQEASKEAFLRMQEQAWQTKYEAERQRNEFAAKAKEMATEYRFIKDADVPLAVKNKMLEAAGYEAEPGIGTSIKDTTVNVAITAVALAVIGFVVYQGVKYFFLNDGSVATVADEPENV